MTSKVQQVLLPKVQQASRQQRATAHPAKVYTWCGFLCARTFASKAVLARGGESCQRSMVAPNKTLSPSPSNTHQADGRKGCEQVNKAAQFGKL